MISYPTQQKLKRIFYFDHLRNKAANQAAFSITLFISAFASGGPGEPYRALHGNP